MFLFIYSKNLYEYSELLYVQKKSNLYLKEEIGYYSPWKTYLLTAKVPTITHDPL